jgi:hypothetical protein
MVATTEIEREMGALTAMRFNWRGQPEMLAMVDAALVLLTRLTESDDAPPPEIEEAAVEFAGKVRAGLAVMEF